MRKLGMRCARLSRHFLRVILRQQTDTEVDGR
jgi:hypothetical protein